MEQIVQVECCGKTITIETGKIAKQASGAVMIKSGDTMVLVTAVAMKSAKEGQGFFPLTVNYQEKTFAASKIPGGFFKREGRPSEKETLVSRLIDRPIRPHFAKGYKNETQVICTVLSHDMENDPDIDAMVGASSALTLSGLPFLGPIGAEGLRAAVGRIREVDPAVGRAHDVVRTVERLALEVRRDRDDAAVRFGARDLPGFVMAGEETSLPIEGVAVRFFRRLAERLDAARRVPSAHVTGRDVAEDEEFAAGMPHRPLGELEPGAELLERGGHRAARYHAVGEGTRNKDAPGGRVP